MRGLGEMGLRQARAPAAIAGAAFSARTSRVGFKCSALDGLHWMERRAYTLDCNWKVFVDNYLDGGYHVPHLHKGLDSVLDYSDYTITNGERFCLQSSPMVRRRGGADRSGAQGDRAFYYWIYPNFMINCYGGAMDTNLVIPRGVDRTEVIFDFYFSDVSDRRAPPTWKASRSASRYRTRTSAICASVQRGLRSRAYGPAGCRCGAKPESISSIVSSATISRPA